MLSVCVACCGLIHLRGPVPCLPSKTLWPLLSFERSRPPSLASVLAALASFISGECGRQGWWTWKDWFAFSPGSVLTGLGLGLYSVGSRSHSCLGWVWSYSWCCVFMLGAVTKGRFIFSFLECGGQESCCVFSPHPLSFSCLGVCTLVHPLI